MSSAGSARNATRERSTSSTPGQLNAYETSAPASVGTSGTGPSRVNDSNRSSSAETSAAPAAAVPYRYSGDSLKMVAVATAAAGWAGAAPGGSAGSSAGGRRSAAVSAAAATGSGTPAGCGGTGGNSRCVMTTTAIIKTTANRRRALSIHSPRHHSVQRRSGSGSPGGPGSDSDHGTGSYPRPPRGWHRSRRRAASQTPRPAP